MLHTAAVGVTTRQRRPTTRARTRRTELLPGAVACTSMASARGVRVSPESIPRMDRSPRFGPECIPVRAGSASWLCPAFLCAVGSCWWRAARPRPAAILLTGEAAVPPRLFPQLGRGRLQLSRFTRRNQRASSRIVDFVFGTCDVVAQQCSNRSGEARCGSAGGRRRGGRYGHCWPGHPRDHNGWLLWDRSERATEGALPNDPD